MNRGLLEEFIDLGETEFHSPGGCLEQPQALQAAQGGSDSSWIYFPDTPEWEWILSHTAHSGGRKGKPIHFPY